MGLLRIIEINVNCFHLNRSWLLWCWCKQYLGGVLNELE